MFLNLEQILLSYASHIHLAIFAPAVSFIEEVIPPIPSPSVMIATGSMAQVQHYAFYSLIFLALLGAIGKTLGASVVYFVVSKVEDILTSKIAKFIGITQDQIESFGARLSKGPKDYVVLILLRALPIVPSSLISVGCGLLKIKFRLFVIATFVGSFIRDFIYIYLGYIGTKAVLRAFVNNTTSLESIIQIIVVIAVVIILGYLYYRRGREKK